VTNTISGEQNEADNEICPETIRYGVALLRPAVGGAGRLCLLCPCDSATHQEVERGREMSTFGIKCPGCGILLEADENDIGAKVECTECGQSFTLIRDSDPSSAGTANETVTFSFDQPSGRLEHTKPVSLTLPDGTIPVNSWTLVLKECVSYALQNNRKKIESLRDVEAPFRKSILFSSTPGNMRKPEQLSADLYMETHFSAFDIVKFVRGLMDYCEFPSHEFAISYRKILSSANTPKKDFDENSPESAFVKQLDFSTFTSGITIPISCHQVFLSHLSGNLNRGESHPVTIKIGNQSFNVMITNVGFSDSSRPTYLKFYWHRNSPIAKSFQATFPAAYQQLSEDHSSRDGIDTVLTVSCGEQPDIFQIAMDTPLVESKELDATAQAETAAPVSPETSTSETVSCSEDTTNDENQLAELLQTEFANGVRPGSIIDQKKIRKLYQQYFDADLPEDFDFAAILPRVGIAHSGKVFPKPTSKQGGWRSLIDKLVSEGNTLFQFSRLVELHADELMKSGIGSGELLQKIMTRDAPDSYDISGGFFAPRGLDAISCRIAAAIMPQEGAIIDILATSKQLPYVDTAYIRNWCKGLDNLVWIGQDVYAIAERIEFDDTEVARGRSCCETAITEEGFFSLSQLSLDDSAAMNDLRMTDSAFRRVFFQRFLSDDFEAHGQIVCAKGANIDGQIPLHAFLQEHSDVTLDQLEAVAKEYNIVLWQALKTAHEEMARVDRDRFVAPGMVPFDIAAIDSAIANVCEDVPMPLGSFTNLSNFPAVPGWTWNAYLLESFLRRSSAAFRLLSSTSFTKDPTGAVVPRKLDDCSPEDIFAVIARRCGVAAETEEVGNFLVATQCIMRRTPKTVGAVVARMKELEKR